MKDKIDIVLRQQHEIQILLEKSEGEITPEIDLLMKELDIDVKSKILWLCKKYEEHLLKAEARNKKLEKVTKQKNSAIKTSEWFKKHIDSLMKANKFENLELDEFSLSYRKSTTTNIINEKLIPEKYFVEKISESISKTKIKNDINSGIKVPGAEIKINKKLQIE